jgi:hypothetical protein
MMRHEIVMPPQEAWLLTDCCGLRRLDGPQSSPGLGTLSHGYGPASRDANVISASSYSKRSICSRASNPAHSPYASHLCLPIRQAGNKAHSTMSAVHFPAATNRSTICQVAKTPQTVANEFSAHLSFMRNKRYKIVATEQDWQGNNSFRPTSQALPK